MTDFQKLFFVFFLKSRRTDTSNNLTHFVQLKISYGQSTTGLFPLHGCSLRSNPKPCGKRQAVSTGVNDCFGKLMWNSKFIRFRLALISLAINMALIYVRSWRVLLRNFAGSVTLTYVIWLGIHTLASSSAFISSLRYITLFLALCTVLFYLNLLNINNSCLHLWHIVMFLCLWRLNIMGLS